MTTAAASDVDVSVLIPVLNEEPHIRGTVAAMLAQRFDGTFELLFAEGRSEDRTRVILEELAHEDPRIRVLDNPLRRTASGLNVCLREARGEYVARMDAHTFYADSYLAAGVARLQAGDVKWVAGPAVPRDVGPVSAAVGLALASPLGRGGSRKWSSETEATHETELDTGVFGGVWRRTDLLAIGGWDERWPINQDSEMAARFLARGDRIVCLAEMAGHYIPRNDLRKLAEQYWRYGYYRARTFRRHPASMRRSHLVAPVLVAATVAALVAPRSLRRLARLSLGVYAGAIAVTAADATVRRREGKSGALLAVVLPTMHLGWGFGTWAGVARFGPPTAALRELFRAAAPVCPDEPVADVYAPSLHAPRGPPTG